MATDPIEERQQAHALLDMLPSEKLAAVRSLLEVMVEPLDRSLAAATVEDEDISPGTAAAIERARASRNRGEGISHKDVMREFGQLMSRLRHIRSGGPYCRDEMNSPH